MTDHLLRKMRKTADEAVRRGIEYDDWAAECIPHLMRKGEDQFTATALCRRLWRAACHADQEINS